MCERHVELVELECKNGRSYSFSNLVMIYNSERLAVPVPSDALTRASGVGSKQDITA